MTPLSKTIAMVLFIALPFVGFYLGTQYQRAMDRPYIDRAQVNPTPTQDGGVACTMEAKLCSDGVTYVGRSGPNCEFEKCPGEE